MNIKDEIAKIKAKALRLIAKLENHPQTLHPEQGGIVGELRTELDKLDALNHPEPEPEPAPVVEPPAETVPPVEPPKGDEPPAPPAEPPPAQ